MKYRTFPKLGNLKLSQFGMGLMRLPVIDGDHNKIDRGKAAEMVDAAITGGVNYFDTAYPYHGGDSQRFAGEYLVPRLEKEGLHLATKLPLWKPTSYDDYGAILDEQLDTLGLKQIEFYLLHGLGGERWKEHKEKGILDFLDYAISEKKIKYPCFSFHGSYDTFTDVIDSYDKWIFAQIQLNYVDENVQAGVRGMRYAYSKDVGVVFMEPLKGGTLVNSLPDKTKNMFEKNGLSPVTAAMNWCYNFKEPTVVLSGVSTLSQTLGQIEIASSAGAGMLTTAEKEALRFAKENFNIIPCSVCEYCQPCPFGVRIPRILHMHNGYSVFGRENAKQAYQRMAGDGGGADKCTECGACEDICPQSIKIISELKKAHAEMSI